MTVVVMSLVGMASACSKLGGPDEFSVLKNPPLVVPPDYHLRPPGEDSDVKGAYSPKEIAKKALFGDNNS